VDQVFDASFEVLRRDRRIGEFPVGDSSQLEWRVHVEKMRLPSNHVLLFASTPIFYRAVSRLVFGNDGVLTSIDHNANFPSFPDDVEAMPLAVVEFRTLIQVDLRFSGSVVDLNFWTSLFKHDQNVVYRLSSFKLPHGSVVEQKCRGHSSHEFEGKSREETSLKRRKPSVTVTRERDGRLLTTGSVIPGRTFAIESFWRMMTGSSVKAGICSTSDAGSDWQCRFAGASDARPRRHAH
jgi:hypothetical protein